MSAPLHASSLRFRYPERDAYVLKGIDLEVGEGEVLAIVGLSGCGKTTLCHCLCGIIPLIYKGDMQGEVCIEGEPTTELTLPQIATRVGIVFQNPETQLFSPTVEDEVAFGPENLCLDREEIGARITSALRQVGMERYRHHSPQELSGGEKQLIALASVLSLKPRILIFDEAGSQLDHRSWERIETIIQRLKDEGKTVLLIEHDLNKLGTADRTLELRDGRLEPFHSSHECGLSVSADE